MSWNPNFSQGGGGRTCFGERGAFFDELVNSHRKLPSARQSDSWVASAIPCPNGRRPRCCPLAKQGHSQELLRGPILTLSSPLNESGIPGDAPCVSAPPQHVYGRDGSTLAPAPAPSAPHRGEAQNSAEQGSPQDPPQHWGGPQTCPWQETGCRATQSSHSARAPAAPRGPRSPLTNVRRVKSCHRGAPREPSWVPWSEGRANVTGEAPCCST